MKTINDLRESSIDVDLSIERTLFIFFDIETTGLHPDKGATIYEIACLTRNDTLFYWNQDKNHATDKKLANVLQKLISQLKQRIIVGHNLSFDFGFIAYKAGKLGIRGPDVLYIDTLSLASRLLVKSNNYKLESLLKHFDILVNDNLHTALVDAQATRALFWKLIEFGDINTVKETGIKKLNWSVSW